MRLACGVVETASDVAEINNEEHVTLEHVEEALKIIRVYLDGAILCQAQEAVECPEPESLDLSPDR